MAHLRLPPELLLLVMKHIEKGESFRASRKSLLNAMLVNHEWAEASSYILWRSPPVSALASVSADRRQYYANKISELSCENDEDAKYHATYKDLSFPRLKDLYIQGFNLREDDKLHLTQYMQPQLKNLDLHGGSLCENDLATLASNCPRLKDLYLDESIDGAEQDHIVDFFRSCNSLEVVSLGDGWAALEPESFAALAGHKGLQELYIGSVAAEFAVCEGLSTISAPFQNLQMLTMTLESEAVLPLASAVTSVHILHLTIEDSEHDALTSLGALKGLKCLKLTFLDDTELTQEGFRALECMKELRSLTMDSRGAPLSASWMDDNLFIKFTSKLPKLANLRLSLDLDITTTSLTALARAHPAFEYFDFFGEFEFSDWSRISKPLFPNLIRFVVEAPFIEGRTRRYGIEIDFRVQIQPVLKS
ncbi:hypothetical protein KCU71_g14295, partial [Aureobasidium melanogenum]